MKEKNKKAFTLVELLAVIVILGILLTLAIPYVQKFVEKSEKKSFYTSVSNIVNKIKLDNLIEEKDYCMYNYKDDKDNQTKIINSMFVLAHKENGNIVYSVYAKNKQESVDIDAYDFKETNIDKPNEWVKKYENSYSKLILELANPNMDDNGGKSILDLEKYQICELKEG